MSNINNENDLQAAKDYINNSNAAAVLKAKELVDFYYPFMDVDSEWAMIENAKLCALKAVDEILNAWPHTYDLEKEYLTGGAAVSVIRNIRSNISYWEEVKQEITKIKSL